MKKYTILMLLSLLMSGLCNTSAADNTAATSQSVVGKNIWNLPDFTLDGADGKKHQLKEWQGKIILLNFWASWCAPCQHEIKYFTHYQKKLAAYNFQIVSIGLDDRLKLKKIARTLEINYPILFADAEKKSTQDMLAQWGNDKGYIPYSVIINSDGNIHYIHHGLLDEGTFKKYILPLLK